MENSSAKFEVIHEIISREDNVQNIKELCAIAGVSRSGYYNWVASADRRAEREASDQSDFEKILEAYIIKDSGLRQSMSRRGNCWDNAPQESFFGHMKDEIGSMIKEAESFDEVRKIIDDWMDYYNNDRYQWQLAKLSPNEYYEYLTSEKYPLPKPPIVTDTKSTK